MLQTVYCLQNDDFIEAVIDLQASVRKEHFLCRWSGRGFGMRLRVVKLLLKDSLTLCRVTDADQRKAASNLPSWILGGCRLVHARRNTTHHFPPEQAGFVEYENLRVLQICLQV